MAVHRYTRASEGTKLRNAVSAAERILRLHLCEFKFGMARLLGQRWLMYQDSDSDKWRPTHLFLLTEVCGREATGYMEAALIVQFIDIPFPGCSGVDCLAAPRSDGMHVCVRSCVGCFANSFRKCY